MRELSAGAHAELTVDAREHSLHGVLGEEESGRHFAVRMPLGDELGDPAFGLRQLAARRSAAADASELGASLLGPQRRTELFEACLGVLERGAGGAAPFRAPLRSPEREQRARVVERIAASCMLSDCLLEAAKAPSRSPRAARRSARERARIASAQARSSAVGAGSATFREPVQPRRARRLRLSASSRSPSSSRIPGSSTKSLRSSYERRKCGSAVAASPSESSTKPSTQRMARWAMRIPSSSARAIALCALARASSMRPR